MILYHNIILLLHVAAAMAAGYACPTIFIIYNKFCKRTTCVGCKSEGTIYENTKMKQSS